MIYARNQELKNAILILKINFIGGEWVKPVREAYFGKHITG